MAAQNPSVVLAFRVQDETSGPLQNIENKLSDVQDEVNETSFSLSQAGQNFVVFGAGLAASAGGLASLAETLGIIPETMQDTVRNTVTAIGAVAALAGGLAQLVPVIRAVATAERARAIASAFATALSNPLVGIALVAAALATGVAAAAVIGQFQTSPGQERRVPGPFNQPQLAVVHGGETIGRPREERAGFGDAAIVPAGEERAAGRERQRQDININAGVIVADENGLRELERRLGRIRLEERRTRGTIA